jgi:hypothetical protein
VIFGLGRVADAPNFVRNWLCHAAGLLSTAKRSTLSPEMPTVAEATGIANFDFPL